MPRGLSDFAAKARRANRSTSLCVKYLRASPAVGVAVKDRPTNLSVPAARVNTVDDGKAAVAKVGQNRLMFKVPVQFLPRPLVSRAAAAHRKLATSKAANSGKSTAKYHKGWKFIDGACFDGIVLSDGWASQN